MKRPVNPLFFHCGVLIIAALFVAVIMWLWNLLIPGITGWTTINFWQALGLAVLARLLTGHPSLSEQHRKFHKFRGHRHLHEMSREERYRFIRGQLKRLSEDLPGDEQ